MSTAPHIALAVYVATGAGFVLPAVVGQVTKAHWASWLKGATLLALSALTSALSLWVDALNSHTPFTWQQFVLGFFGAAVAAQTAHSSVLRYTPLTNTVTSIAPMSPLPPYPPAGRAPGGGPGPNPGDDPAPLPTTTGGGGGSAAPPTVPAAFGG